MDRPLAISALNHWQTTIRAWDGVRDQFAAITLAAPECPLNKAVDALIDAYSNSLAANLGCLPGELDWFRFDCDFGATPRECILPDGTTIIVSSIPTFLETITP